MKLPLEPILNSRERNGRLHKSDAGGGHGTNRRPPGDARTRVIDDATASGLRTAGRPTAMSSSAAGAALTVGVRGVGRVWSVGDVRVDGIGPA